MPHSHDTGLVGYSTVWFVAARFIVADVTFAPHEFSTVIDRK